MNKINDKLMKILKVNPKILGQNLGEIKWPTSETIGLLFQFFKDEFVVNGVTNQLAMANCPNFCESFPVIEFVCLFRFEK